MIRILGTIFAGLLGLAFGSFLNVCLSRWPQQESAIEPRSHCRHCDHVLAWWENVPVISWLALRGRCRSCRAWIGWRYPLVEGLIAGLWAFSAWRAIPDTLDTLFSLALALPVLALAVGEMIQSWVLVALAVFDAENFWLPNALTLPGIAAGVTLSVVRVQGGVNTAAAAMQAVTASLLAAAIAALLILAVRWIYWLVRRREGIGLGDAKLMALLGAWLGLPGALLAFGLGAVLGALAGLLVFASPAARSGKTNWAATRLPLGTFLCVGGLVSEFWGQPIIAAYMRWAGL